MYSSKSVILWQRCLIWPCRNSHTEVESTISSCIRTQSVCTSPPTSKEQSKFTFRVCVSTHTYKCSSILQNEDRSQDVVSQKKSLVVFGWFIPYVMHIVLSDPSHPLSLLLCVSTCLCSGPALLLNACGALSTASMCFSIRGDKRFLLWQETTLSHLGGRNWELLT